MFDFDDELMIESYRIPWLIWIQLLVMFLLIILLYSFSIFALDLSQNSASPSSSAGLFGFVNRSHIDKPLPDTTTTAANDSSCLYNTKVRENQNLKGDMGTSRSRSKRVVKGEDIQELEDEGCSIKDATLSEQSHHPCNYFGLAKQAFLKCLGLAPTSENSKRKQRKDR